jgi:hypothetical protein
MALSCNVLATRLNKRAIIEAEIGKYPRYFYYLYQKYHKSFRKPKVVLYGVDYFVFGWKSSPEQLARLGQNITSETMALARAVNIRSPLLSRISWLYRKKQQMDNFLIDLLHLERESGLANSGASVMNKKPGHGQKGSGDVSNGPLEMMVKPDSWPTFAYRRFPGREGCYFDRLLADLERQAIPVILILIPDHIGTNETNFEQDKFKSDIQALAARHHGVFVLDFNRSDRFNLNDPGLFNDGGWGKTNCHLSPKGREIFTRLLVPKVKKILAEAGKQELSEGREKR